MANGPIFFSLRRRPNTGSSKSSQQGPFILSISGLRTTKLSIRHTHVGFVRLHIVRGYWLQLSGWCSIEEFLENGQIKGIGGPVNKAFEINFRDATDRVDVG